MKKTLLVGLGVFAFTTASFASDITNPFYLPSQGQVGSITSVAFDKGKGSVLMTSKTGRIITKNVKSYDRQIQEDIQYGLTDSVAFFGGIGTSFSKLRGKGSDGSVSVNNSDNNASFSAGLAWNALKGPTRLQLHAGYSQARGGYKSAEAEARMGYQFKTFLPYVSVGLEKPIAQSGADGKPGYAAKIGVYQGACEIWALDTGLRWLHDESSELTGYQAEAEASYYLTPKVAFSLFGTYLLDAKGKGNMDIDDESFGLRLRWFLN